jgi:glycosyltransferase involved in cell wall biosynthesis
MVEHGLTESGHSVRTVFPTPRLGRLKPSATGLGKWLGYVDRFMLFPVTLLRSLPRTDVVHICDHGNAVYMPLLKSIPHIITCHDLFGVSSALGEVAQNRVSWTGRVLASAMMRGLNCARCVACVSAHTRDELLRVSSLSAERVRVIENGLDERFAPMAEAEALERLRALRVPERPFLLHVGGNQWYKNRLGVLRIFAELVTDASFASLTLVTAGKGWTNEMHRVAEERGLLGRVIALTRIDDEDLRALYSIAQALLFPSLSEGFGWPVIEAQACGCPVFTSNRLPLNVVGGIAARYLDPTDPVSAAAVLREGLEDRERMRILGFENAKRYSAERMVTEYLSAYRDAITEHARTS